MEYEPELNVPHLNIDQFIPFQTATSNEAKCLVLCETPEGEMRSEKDIRKVLASPSAQGQLQRIGINHIHNIVNSFPEGLVVVEKNPEGGYSVERTLRGSLAAALGGHLLNLSLISSWPIRNYVGQPVDKRELPNEDETVNSLEARLVVLTSLFTLARGSWQNMATLHEENAKYGVDKELGRNHIKRLAKAHLVDYRESPILSRTKHQFQSRIKPDNGFFSPEELISRYLTIVGRFSLLNPSFINDGLEHMDRIRSQLDSLPYLIKRSFASTNHTGKTYIHRHTKN